MGSLELQSEQLLMWNFVLGDLGSDGLRLKSDYSFTQMLGVEVSRRIPIYFCLVLLWGVLLLVQIRICGMNFKFWDCLHKEGCIDSQYFKLANRCQQTVWFYHQNTATSITDIIDVSWEIFRVMTSFIKTGRGLRYSMPSKNGVWSFQVLLFLDKDGLQIIFDQSLTQIYGWGLQSYLQPTTWDLDLLLLIWNFTCSQPFE